MSKFLKNSIGFALAFTLSALCLSGCSLVFPSEKFTHHQAHIINNTAVKLWVAYRVENRLLDTAGGGYDLKINILDTAFLMEPRGRYPLFVSQLRTFQRLPMDSTELSEKIISLRFSEITDSDTLALNVDYLSENHLKVWDSDPFYYTEIIHYYDISVLSSDLD